MRVLLVSQSPHRNQRTFGFHENLRIQPLQDPVATVTAVGQPRIDDYANNDGWFDDTSDGPVMARLAMFSPLVGRVRYIDVEYPAWVVCGYPAYVPEILDVVTMDDVIEDMAIRKFAERTDLYGTSGTFNDPQHIPPTDEGALIHWRALSNRIPSLRDCRNHVSSRKYFCCESYGPHALFRPSFSVDGR